MSLKKKLTSTSQGILYEINDYFNRRAYGAVFLNLFEQIAHTLTDEYVQNVYQCIEDNGFAPSFEELLENVRSLNDELSRKAIWLREDYKIERGKRSAKLTKGCKRIINHAIHDYLQRSKTVLAIKRQQSLVY